VRPCAWAPTITTLLGNRILYYTHHFRPHPGHGHPVTPPQHAVVCRFLLHLELQFKVYIEVAGFRGREEGELESAKGIY
jgi:hypothetical protein